MFFGFYAWAILFSAMYSAPAIPIVVIAIVLSYRCRSRVAKVIVLSLGGVLMWTIATMMLATEAGQNWKGLTEWPNREIWLTLPYLFSAIVAMTWIGWVNVTKVQSERS
jgi:hypothetical protein